MYHQYQAEHDYHHYQAEQDYMYHQESDESFHSQHAIPNSSSSFTSQAADHMTPEFLYEVKSQCCSRSNFAANLVRKPFLRR